jgi:hypothetical protein
MHHLGLSHPRVRRLVPALLAAAAVMTLAVPAPALAGGFTARLYAPNHQPKVGLWHITVTANRGSQKLGGNVYYRFLYQGTPVSRQAGHGFSGGVFHDTLNWPARAVGHTITLQVVVSTRYGTDSLNWWIKVRR